MEKVQTGAILVLSLLCCCFGRQSRTNKRNAQKMASNKKIPIFWDFFQMLRFKLLYLFETKGRTTLEKLPL